MNLSNHWDVLKGPAQRTPSFWGEVHGNKGGSLFCGGTFCVELSCLCPFVRLPCSRLFLELKTLPFPAASELSLLTLLSIFISVTKFTMLSCDQSCDQNSLWQLHLSCWGLLFWGCSVYSQHKYSYLAAASRMPGTLSGKLQYPKGVLGQEI